MTPLLLAMMFAHNPVVMVREPLSPSYRQLSTRADCGRRSLVFSDYGASVITGGTPKVSFDERPLTGPQVGQLIADLSATRAVYRLSVQCERSGDVTVRIYEGEAQRDGTVRFRVARARIKSGRLDYYSGLKPADAETFWYR